MDFLKKDSPSDKLAFKSQATPPANDNPFDQAEFMPPPPSAPKHVETAGDPAVPIPEAPDTAIPKPPTTEVQPEVNELEATVEAEAPAAPQPALKEEAFMPPASQEWSAEPSEPTHSIPDTEPEHTIPDKETPMTVDDLDNPPRPEPELTLPDLPMAPSVSMTHAPTAFEEEIKQEQSIEDLVPAEEKPHAAPEDFAMVEAEQELDEELSQEKEVEIADVSVPLDDIAPPPKPEEATIDDSGQEWTEEPTPTEFAQQPVEEHVDNPLKSTPEVAPVHEEFVMEDAEYLPEEKDVEQEYFVEAHAFYGALQDIKAAKKSLRDQDADMRAWEEIDLELEKKTANVLGEIDTLQEDLIKIDTTLFEG